MNGCPFCNIQQEPKRILKEGKLCMTFLSNPRLTKGHTLVVPKRHVEKPSDLTEEEVLEIFHTILWVEETLSKNGIGEGYDIRENYRPFIPQNDLKIDHIHFHVLPRTDKDELYETAMQHEVKLFAPLTDTERANLTNLFRN